MSKKISISIGMAQRHFGEEQAMRFAAAAGFDGIDLALTAYGETAALPDIYSMDDYELTKYFTRIKNLADDLGLVIAQSHNLSGAYTPDPERNKQLFRRAERSLKAAQIVGCPYSVVHCISTYQWGWDVPDEVMHEANQAMYRELIPYAEEYGVTIALESFGACKLGGVDGFDHFTDPEKMLREYECLETENKAFCFDSGHTNCGVPAGYPDPQDFVRLFGSRIKLLHLNDNAKNYDQHCFPGQGLIKWQEVFAALDEIGYDGFYNFELHMPFGMVSEATYRFLGEYLRYFVENKGRITWPDKP